MDISHFKSLLESRLNELRARISDIDTLLQQPLSADFEDQATDLEGQESLEVIEHTARGEVRAIQHALMRIKNGKYGICIKCGEEIPNQRLNAVPTALRCMKCETQLAKS